MVKSYHEQMQEIVTKYINAKEVWPATTHEIAFWAMNHKPWAPQTKAIIDICAEQLARAMRAGLNPSSDLVPPNSSRRISGDNSYPVLGQQGCHLIPYL